MRSRGEDLRLALGGLLCLSLVVVLPAALVRLLAEYTGAWQAILIYVLVSGCVCGLGWLVMYAIPWALGQIFGQLRSDGA